MKYVNCQFSRTDPFTFLYSSAGSNLDSSGYVYNQGNQRILLHRNGAGSTVTFAYDPIGQLVSDTAQEGTHGAARLNEQLYYGFDPAGNLAARTNNALVQNFAVNSLNELTSNANSGTLTVVGTTTSKATNVTVNGNPAIEYNDATFAATNMPLTTTYTAVAQDSLGRIASNTVTVNLGTNVAFQYDANGNLTNDGLRSFAYDDENQLTQVWVTNQWLSQFTYDAKMRRRIRQEYTWSSTIGNWSLTNEVRYIYDGNLVIQERDINNTPLVTYTRGKDLSGGLEGAGGIGGLLARTSQEYSAAPMAGHSYYHCDGNGNVTCLINSSQAIVAKYLYCAFGNVLSKSGLLADANTQQFSSKEKHSQSGLLYYLYRFYDPNLQRWPNRDPLEERGGLNLYGFLHNDPENAVDLLGLGGLVPGAGNPGKGNQQSNAQKCCKSRGGNYGSTAGNKYGGDMAACVRACVANSPGIGLFTWPAGGGIGGGIGTMFPITGGIIGGIIGQGGPYAACLGACSAPGCSLDQSTF